MGPAFEETNVSANDRCVDDIGLGLRICKESKGSKIDDEELRGFKEALYKLPYMKPDAKHRHKVIKVLDLILRDANVPDDIIEDARIAQNEVENLDNLMAVLRIRLHVWQFIQRFLESPKFFVIDLATIRLLASSPLATTATCYPSALPTTRFLASFEVGCNNVDWGETLRGRPSSL
jgi:hypothetical protein